MYPHAAVDGMPSSYRYMSRAEDSFIPLPYVQSATRVEAFVHLTLAMRSSVGARHLRCELYPNLPVANGGYPITEAKHSQYLTGLLNYLSNCAVTWTSAIVDMLIRDFSDWGRELNKDVN